MTDAPQSNPGDINNWPVLQIVYRTDPDKIATLLPPGIDPGDEPNVHLRVYRSVVAGRPEFGLWTAVEADYQGTKGVYSLAYAIDLEAAVFISLEQNGQPKHPASLEYYRDGDRVFARCMHQNYTFFEFDGKSTGAVEPLPEHDLDEWWIKSSRAVSAGAPTGEFDFPPHVVHVRQHYGAGIHREEVEGTLKLTDSPWDPIARLLPVREQLSAHLNWVAYGQREIKLAGKIDPDAFFPYSDTISGSRWPGFIGGPRPE